MPYKDLHSEPFDETTITKLEIFENYAEAWIPTFLMQKEVMEIHIFDFFSGPGYDVNNALGSPIRLLNQIDSFLILILRTKTKVVLHLNEFEPGKVRQEKYMCLEKNCQEFLDAHPKFRYFIEVKCPQTT
jgi:three-Cys-motif partner protein